MENFKRFIGHLKSFDESRKSLPSPSDRDAYAEAIAECFVPCAKGILAGHFRVKDKDGKVIREIHPTVIELYYHEEGPGGFKDPIMYHTKDRKYYDYYLDRQGQLKNHGKGSKNYFEKRGISDLPYFPMGSLNPHTSGIDITFENSEKQYRASFLIRGYNFYRVENDKVVDPFKCPNSTDIYDDMLINGIPLENADWIEWVDGKVEDQTLTPEEYLQKHCTSRQNVPAYEPANVHPEDENCPVLWKKKQIKADSKPPYIKSGDLIYEHCSFPWQFNKADISKKK